MDLCCFLVVRRLHRNPKKAAQQPKPRLQKYKVLSCSLSPSHTSANLAKALEISREEEEKMGHKIHIFRADFQF